MTKLRLRKILRYAIGFIFLIAAVSKFINPFLFGNYLNTFQILPGSFILPAVYILSGLEFTLSLLLVFNFHSSKIVAFFLILIFCATVYSTWLYFSGVKMKCGCFGGFLDRELGVTYFLTNGLVCIGLIAYLTLNRKRNTLR